MGRHAQLAALLMAGFGAACSTDSTVTKTQVRRGTTSAVATAGTTTGTATGGSVSSTGSGSSTGTTTAASSSGSSTSGAPSSCPNLYDAGAIPLTDCAPGQVELLGQVLNYCKQGAPVSGGLTLTDVLDSSTVIRADSCGIFRSCTQPNAQIEVHIDSAGLFVPTTLPLTQPSVSTEISLALDLVCDQLYEALVSQIAGTAAPYNPDAGALFVVIVNGGESGRCGDSSGWQFSATDRNGNPVSGDTAYISATGYEPQATFTDVAGLAIIYNLDPALQIAMINAVDTYADGGVSACQNYAAASPLTEMFPVEAGRVTDAVWGITKNN